MAYLRIKSKPLNGTIMAQPSKVWLIELLSVRLWLRERVK